MGAAILAHMRETKKLHLCKVSFANLSRTTHLLAAFTDRGRFNNKHSSKKFNCARTYSKTVPASIFVKLTAGQRYYVENPYICYCYKLIQQNTHQYCANIFINPYMFGASLAHHWAVWLYKTIISDMLNDAGFTNLCFRYNNNNNNNNNN